MEILLMCYHDSGDKLVGIPINSDLLLIGRQTKSHCLFQNCSTLFKFMNRKIHVKFTKQIWNYEIFNGTP